MHWWAQTRKSNLLLITSQLTGTGGALQTTFSMAKVYKTSQRL